ncbi:MAG: VOC family protein [Sphingobium sp.]|nr:VOC family protein [Sphingobium sp.]
MKSVFLPLGLIAASALAAPALAQPAVPSLQHYMLGMSVGDIDKMTTWYGDMLGFKVAKELAMGQGGKLRFLENGNERIEMVYAPGSKPGEQKPLPPAAAIQGYVQLTMEVPDLDAARAALAAKGAAPSAITPIPPLGIRVIFMRDPEGNIVELVQKLKN